jgi:hypothetical protein
MTGAGRRVVPSFSASFLVAREIRGADKEAESGDSINVFFHFSQLFSAAPLGAGKTAEKRMRRILSGRDEANCAPKGRAGLKSR